MRTAVIYGSTGTGKQVFSIVQDKYDILFFVDENPERIGKRNGEKSILNRDEIFKYNPDYVIMGQLTGCDEAISFLIQSGWEEGRIISQYVDLPARARRACVESISCIVNTRKIDGAVAELGVYRGDFAKVINEIFSDRKLYLFDTFEGFPEEDLSYEFENGLLTNEVGRLANTSVDYVLGKLPFPSNCVIRKGYFPATSNGLESEKFVFVNIDVDLYKPIKAGLEFFWPRMARGGYILVHDYFSNAYAGTKLAIEEFAKKEGIGFVPIGDTFSISFVKT